jgi:hypothetical protein
MRCRRQCHHARRACPFHTAQCRYCRAGGAPRHRERGRTSDRRQRDTWGEGETEVMEVEVQNTPTPTVHFGTRLSSGTPNHKEPMVRPMHEPTRLSSGTPNHKEPMVRPMHEPTRCGARTSRGIPCQSPAVRGKRRCRMHGGAPGSGAPSGRRNGNGRRACATRWLHAARHWLE